MASLSGKTFADIYPKLLQNPSGNIIQLSDGTDLSTINAATMLQIGGTDIQDSGTWTPADASGAGLTFSVDDADYERVGNIVVAAASLTYPTTSNTTRAEIGGLPYTVQSGTAFTIFGGYWMKLLNTTDGPSGNAPIPLRGDTSILIRDNVTLAARDNAYMSDADVRFTIIYFI